MKKERWLSVVGFEGLYEVSDLGRVKSVKRTCPHRFNGTRVVNERVLKLSTSYTGYCSAKLHNHDGGKTMNIHKLVARAFLGVKKADVDHINGVRNDNRLENLRYCTRSQNLANSKKRKGSSQFKGVSFRKDIGKWKAQITMNYKNISLGCFDSEKDASIAYREASVKIFGEFARSE